MGRGAQLLRKRKRVALTVTLKVTHAPAQPRSSRRPSREQPRPESGGLNTATARLDYSARRGNISLGRGLASSSAKPGRGYPSACCSCATRGLGAAACC
jgi:hypothetical protein